jgi:predicted metal-dependent peptidase
VEQTERNVKINKLSRDVLTLSRNTLLVNLRFLDVALSQFEYVPIQDSTLLTEGQHIFYNPKYVLECYKCEAALPVRDYLHIVMHCVFQHMYMEPNLEHSYWDLACDIAVENVITELGLKSVSTARELQQLEYIAAVKRDLKYVTAEKIYSYLRQTEPDLTRIAQIRGKFFADDHELWYMTGDEITDKYLQPNKQ